jgi:hypothetical protein
VADLQPTCPPAQRVRDLLRGPTSAHGLRAAQTELVGGVRTLHVWFFRDPPHPFDTDARLWRLVPSPGGRPATIAAAAPVASPTPHVALKLTGDPDTARYRLELAPDAVTPSPTAKFDPLRTWLPVRLRPECPDLGSCFAPAPPDEAPPPSPVHDYGARDWASLRQALVEYLLREQPDADLSLADPTITLLELFAHAGDLLHYRLDRVATEGYLETARLRTSVKRHARLVDFTFAEAVAARTFVHVTVPKNAGTVPVAAGAVAADAPGSPLAFTVERGLAAVDALGEIAIYDWGEDACCLPAGATECVLVRPRPADPLGDAWLQPGDLLAFELVDPLDAARHAAWARRATGQRWPPALAGDSFRAPLPGRPSQVVELVEVEPFTDPLAATLVGGGMRLTRVRWQPADALAAAYPVGIDDGAGVPQVAVARGNVVPAHHGRLTDGPPGSTLTARLAAGDDPTASPTAYDLVRAGAPSRGGRLGGVGLALDERGLPYLLDVQVLLPSGVPLTPPAVTTLLEAPDGELAVVVDVEEHEPPVLRFVTGAVGVRPPAGSVVRAAYELGGGSAGNVPPNALAVLERNTAAPGSAPVWAPVAPGVVARNPVAAAGGAEPTPLDDVRRDAPEAYLSVPERAVLPADYAAAAAADALVQRASARRGWTGSWPLVTTLVDLASDDPAAALPRVQAELDALRVIGTEVAVAEGRAVGLRLALGVCAIPGADPEAVRAAVLGVLRPGSDARPGVFHRSRLQLGASVYVSAAVAAVTALPQVEAVAVEEARRLDEPAGTVHAVIAFAADEVGVLDDDPARPERGRLDVHVGGGL